MRPLFPALLPALALAANAALAAPSSNELSSAPFEKLVFDAQRFGNTIEKKDAKAAAKAELIRRGTNSLQVLMGYAHLENDGIQMFTQELVEKLKPEEAAPVLAEFLGSDKPRTRRLAAYYLGLHESPSFAARIVPLLRDDETRGAAIRALGKWKVKTAVGELSPFVADPKEPRRIAAINALRDIGDPSVAGVLIAALDDVHFTVREAAQAALVSLGAAVEPPVLQAIPAAQGHKLRHLIRILGHYSSWRSKRVLKRYALSENADIRLDAQDALRLRR